MLSFSAHKFRGPQGIGALILRRKNYKLPPVKAVYYGGQQEHGIRPGTTPPVALVAGMGAACEFAANEYELLEVNNKTIKQNILRVLEEAGIDYEINGDQDNCVDSTLNVCFNRVSSEALMISTKQYCTLSSGLACTSKSYDPSYVLGAMGILVEKIENSIRISWGTGLNKDDVISGFKNIIETVKDFSV